MPYMKYNLRQRANSRRCRHTIAKFGAQKLAMSISHGKLKLVCRAFCCVGFKHLVPKVVPWSANITSVILDYRNSLSSLMNAIVTSDLFPSDKYTIPVCQ